MSTTENPKTSLREQVLKALTGSETDNQQVISQLALHSENERPNDIIYAILLELELLHRAVEQIYIRSQEQHKVIGDNLLAAFEEKNRRTAELNVQQQLIFRSQFRLVAIHRERFAVRLLLFGAMLLVTTLAGLGVFYIYTLICH